MHGELFLYTMTFIPLICFFCFFFFAIFINPIIVLTIIIMIEFSVYYMGVFDKILCSLYYMDLFDKIFSLYYMFLICILYLNMFDYN